MFLQIGYKSLSYELQEQHASFELEALFGKFASSCICFFAVSNYCSLILYSVYFHTVRFIF